jgi:hypothetical protein
MASETADAYTIFSNICLPEPDECRTFDNGIDLFGKEDPEFDRIRNKFGEEYSGSRLILYRSGKKDPIMAKLWLTYTWDSSDGCFLEFLLYVSSATAAAVNRAAKLSGVYIDSNLIDWRPTGGEPSLELSFEVIGEWMLRESLAKVAEAFDSAVNKISDEWLANLRKKDKREKRRKAKKGVVRG